MIVNKITMQFVYLFCNKTSGYDIIKGGYLEEQHAVDQWLPVETRHSQ